MEGAAAPAAPPPLSWLRPCCYSIFCYAFRFSIFDYLWFTCVMYIIYISVCTVELKRSLVYREELSGGVGREMPVDCDVRLAKCAAIECRVRDLLLGLSREFCTAEAVRDVTAGLLADPAYEHILGLESLKLISLAID